VLDVRGVPRASSSPSVVVPSPRAAVPSPSSASPSSEWACGELLEAGARFVQAVRTAPGPLAKARAAASRNGVTTLTDLFRTLPRTTAVLSPAAAGEELRGWFRPDRRLPFNRAPVAVLQLPADRAAYLSGRRRQALRTNLRRAAELGLTCAPVPDEADLLRICRHVTARRGAPVESLLRPEHRPSPSRLFAAAYDRAGDPVAVSQLVADDRWAGLVFMVTSVDHEDASLVRYPLHAHLVDTLVGRGVSSFVVGGSMLLTSTGTRYFQRRTGFTPVRLEVARG
jgi:hypothetical protein